MRRSASEIINNLEMRIARLERQASGSPFIEPLDPRVRPDNSYIDHMNSNPPGFVTAQENREGSSHKFYEMIIENHSTEIQRKYVVKTNFGRIGTRGRSSVQEFSSRDEAEDFMLTRWKKQRSKGYVDIFDSARNDEAYGKYAPKGYDPYGTIMSVISKLGGMDKEAAGGPQLRGVTSHTAYHTGDSFYSASSAMLYYIGADENKSKFYEMVQNGTTVEILYGRLGSRGKSADKFFTSESEAQAFFAKQLQSKLKKGYASAFSRKGEHRKSGPLYGTYPIGLTSNPGPWQNADINYQSRMLQDIIPSVRAAIKSFNDDGIVDDLALRKLEKSLEFFHWNDDDLSKEAAQMIRVSLDRIKGTGRAGRQPLETRTRLAIKDLLKVMRLLEGAMTGGHRH